MKLFLIALSLLTSVTTYSLTVDFLCTSPKNQWDNGIQIYDKYLLRFYENRNFVTVVNNKYHMVRVYKEAYTKFPNREWSLEFTAEKPSELIFTEQEMPSGDILLNAKLIGEPYISVQDERMIDNDDVPANYEPQVHTPLYDILELNINPDASTYEGKLFYRYHGAHDGDHTPLKCEIYNGEYLPQY